MQDYYIEQIYTNCLAEATYYIESQGQAAIIDPLREVEPYLKLAASRGAKIKYVFETHFHADFVSGHLDLARATGAKIVYGPTAEPQYAIHVGADGEVFQLGAITLELLHTPGHTLESMCLLLRDAKQNPYCLFTGDTLFVGDVGRPDLAVKHANMTREQLASHLYDSLQTKILPLSDDIILYPGHGAGSACGKNIGNETYTTLGQQRKLNYALQPMTREQFVDALLDGLAAPPKYFFVDAGINKRGPAPIAEVMQHNMRPLAVAAFEQALHTGATVLDCREASTFEQGFVPGAINIGLGGQFAIWVGTLLDHDQPLLLVTDEGKEAEAVLRLARVGFENVKGFLLGGIASWLAAGKSLHTIQSLTPEAFAEKVKAHTGAVLDVRNVNEAVANGSVAGARIIPLAELPNQLATLSKDQSYMIHCAGGYRSMAAASLLARAGFTQVYNVYGGFAKIKETQVPLAETMPA